MNEIYIKIIKWCMDNPKFSFWIVVFSLSLILLWLIYLILTNFRLHAFIISLKKDKGRLMQEKDLIRLGKDIQDKKDDEEESNNPS